MPVGCAAWGGVSLGLGTLSYAFFSPSSTGCSTNVVVLTQGAVTARGCATFSVLAHVGMGLMVLGVVLLLGAFIVAARARRAVPEDGTTTAVADGEKQAPDGSDAEVRRLRPAAPAGSERPSRRPAEAVSPGAGGGAGSSEGKPAPQPERVGPIPPGGEGPIPPGAEGPIPPGQEGPAGDGPERDRPPRAPVALPPGWYGNPDNPDKPVLWWDGTRLVERPPRRGR